MNRRLLGIDYGSKRIGIAVSDPLRIIARGVAVVANSPGAFSELKRLAEEYDVEKIIVGFPLTLRGEEGFKAVEVNAFIERLGRELGREIIRWDERFSSKMAMQTMIDMGTRKKQRRQKGAIDQMAAALILQQYLDSCPPAGAEETAAGPGETGHP